MTPAPVQDAGATPILLLIAANAVSGPARQLTALATALPAFGFAPTIGVLCRDGHRVDVLTDHIRHHGIPSIVFSERFLGDPRLLGSLAHYLNTSGTRLLETHGYKATAVGALLRIVRPRLRWIGFFHGATQESRRARWYHAIDVFLLRFADRAVVMSEEQRGRLRWIRDHADVIYNAILTPDRHDPTLADRLATVSRPRIVAIGRLSFEKGMDHLLRAFAVARTRLSDATLLIAGDGPEEAALRSLTASLQLSDRVQFLGHVVAIDDLLRQCDVCAIPSRSEGFPNVLLEAVRAHVPVATTDVGGIPEFTRRFPETAAVAASGDVDALAAALITALERAGTAEHGSACERAIEAFGLPSRAAAHGRLYTDVLAS